LAAEFHAELTDTSDILTETPLICPKLYRDIRRAVLHKFPYLVWYRVDNSTVTVLACTHGKIGQTKIRRHIR
jgi:plasmid stabilization system protein ParE